MMHTLPGLSVILASLVQLLNAEAFFSVKFLTFRNSRGLDSRGHCCDDGGSTECLSACDHSFTICLDQIDGSITNMDSCTYGKQISSEIRDTNNINFQDRIANLANPIIWRLPMWPGRVLLKIEVADVDHHKPPDHVAHLYKVISVQPLPSHRGSRFIIGRNVELMLEARTYCGRNFYGHNCSIRCVARDDHRGHYSCHPINGSKICLDGWNGDNCIVKENQCSGVTCLNGGRCQDLPNMFECRCPAGYEGRFCEAEINECLGSDVCRHGDCINTPGSFTCTCFQGFTGDSCSTNIDDCIHSPCQNGAMCIDRIGDFECSCLAGYTGKVCGADIDECQMDPCKHNGTCINIIGDYSCDCPAGYEGNDCSLDTNECDISNPCLNQGICINLLGGYACQCPVGFQGIHCESDINECQNVSVCHHGGVCVNTHGSFTCVCSSEYFGPKCEHDVNECAHNPCKHGGQCQNLPGAYACHCSEGYTGKRCDAGVNECTKDVCKNGGNCTDLDEGFKCTCSQFWTGVTCQQNVDECLSDPCKHGGSCQNLDLGFLCICRVGFHGRLCEINEKECDLAECENVSLCAQDMNTVQCLCPRGWKGQNCNEDIDECEQDICDNNGTCLNTEGGFQCGCSVNWTGQRCEFDVNECEMLPNPCRHGATCNNVQGGFNCECPYGWTGTLCNEDINECIHNPEICQTLANSKNEFSNHPLNTTEVHFVCQNTMPGYSCVCDLGWRGLFCNEDVNECQETPYICSYGNKFLKNLATDPNTVQLLHTVCINTYPGYACVCDEDWTGLNCETRMYNRQLVSGVPSSINEDYSKPDAKSDNRDAQLPGCNSPECLLPNGVNQVSVGQNSSEMAAWNTRAVGWNLNSSRSPEDVNATHYLNRNSSDTVQPFYMDCQLTPERRLVINKGLEQLFWDTHLFLGRRLSVSHRSQVWTSRYGKIVTAIIPVVEVDNRILSNREINNILASVSHKFDDYLRCSASAVDNSGTPSWFPAFISVCVVVVVLVASLALFKYLRRVRKGKKHTFNISASRISKTFREETYKARPKDSLPRNEDSSSVVMRALKERMSIRSLVNMLEEEDNPSGGPLPAKHKSSAPMVEHTPSELSGVLDGRPMGNAGQDRGLEAGLGNTPRTATDMDHVASQHLSKTEYSTPAIRYINIPNVDNSDATETDARTHRHNNQPASSCAVSFAQDAYVEMLRNKEMKAEVHTANRSRQSHRLKTMADRKMAARDIECDKYRGLPYIDDPGYTEINTKEEQDLPSDSRYLK